MCKVKLPENEVVKFFDDLGEENSKKLIEKENREKVLKFCKSLIFLKNQSKVLPAEIFIGDRIYEVIPYLKEKERPITGYEVIRRAEEIGFNLGNDDAEYVLKHQQDIPSILYMYYFIFTDWRVDQDNPDFLYYIDKDPTCNQWCRNYKWKEENYWNHLGLLLRRKH